MTRRMSLVAAIFCGFTALTAVAVEPAMERLAPGCIRPQGWLLKQLELQRDGLPGHAEELYLDIGQSDWLTSDARVVPFMERYFAYQRAAFAGGDGFVKDSTWAVARVGDELDVVLWLYRKTGKAEWLAFAKTVAAQSADWTAYYHVGGRGNWGKEGYRSHIVNFMQGLKTPPLKRLLNGREADRTAYRAALDPNGWAMRLHGRPGRAEDPPPSPVPASAVSGKSETIELVPITFTQLRITLFPWVSGRVSRQGVFRCPDPTLSAVFRIEPNRRGRLS